MTTLLHRLFGLGRLPASDRRALESEHITILDEGVGGSMTYGNYRAPGKVFSRRRRWFTGSLALTQERFVAYEGSRRLINLPLGDPRLLKCQITVEEGPRICVAFDASAFSDDQSGRLEFRFSTAHADEIARALRSEVA